MPGVIAGGRQEEGLPGLEPLSRKPCMYATPGCTGTFEHDTAHRAECRRLDDG